MYIQNITQSYAITIMYALLICCPDVRCWMTLVSLTLDDIPQLSSASCFVSFDDVYCSMLTEASPGSSYPCIDEAVGCFYACLAFRRRRWRGVFQSQLPDWLEMNLALAVISTAKGCFNEAFGWWGVGGHVQIKRTRWTEPNWGFVYMGMANKMPKCPPLIILKIIASLCIKYSLWLLS